jgi:hypothetical protein
MVCLSVRQHPMNVGVGGTCDIVKPVIYFGPNCNAANVIEEKRSHLASGRKIPEVVQDLL